MASEVAAGLTRLGFRVCVGGRGTGAGIGSERLESDRRHSRFRPALRPGVGGAGRRRRRPAAGGARPRLQDTPEHRRARGRRGRRSRCRGAPAGTREAGGLAARLLRPRALAGGDRPGGASAAQFVRCWRPPAHAVHEAGVRGPGRGAGHRRGEQGCSRRGALVEPPDGACSAAAVHAALDRRRGTDGERPVGRVSPRRWQRRRRGRPAQGRVQPRERRVRLRGGQG